MKLLVVVVLAIIIATAKGEADAEATPGAEAKSEAKAGLVVGPGYGLYSNPGLLDYPIRNDIYEDDDTIALKRNWGLGVYGDGFYNPYWYGNDIIPSNLALGINQDFPYGFARPLYGYNALEDNIPHGFKGQVQVVGVPYLQRVDFPFPHFQNAITYRTVPLHGYQDFAHKRIQPVLRGYKPEIHTEIQPTHHGYKAQLHKLHPLNFGYKTEVHKHIHAPSISKTFVEHSSYKAPADRRKTHRDSSNEYR